MVHRGPSTGCLKCRERRTKCDGARPRCKKCVSRGYECSGYRDVGGIVFKDVTRQVCDKQTRRARLAEWTVSRADLKSNDLCIEPQIASICFFYRQYVLRASEDPSPTTGFLEHILPMYSSAAPASALNLSVTAMTARIMCLHHGQEPTSPWHVRRELAATRAIRDAISDPREASRDETLLAVLCAGFARFLAERIAVRDDARAHLDGALALVRYRGPASFGSRISESLLAATRSHVLLQSLWFPDDAESQDLILLLPDVEPRDTNPAVSIHHLLARVLSLNRQMLTDPHGSKNEGDGGHLPSSETSQALILCEQLRGWRRNVSQEWEFFAIPRRPDATIHLENKQSPVEVAYVIGQWHCTYLLALKLAFVVSRRDDTSDETSVAMRVQDILNRTQQVVDSLVFSVMPFFDEADTPRFSWQEPMRKTTELRRRSTGTAGSGEALPPHRRPYLSNLLEWALSTLTEEMSGSDGFGVRPATLEYLSNWHRIVMKGRVDPFE